MRPTTAPWHSTLMDRFCHREHSPGPRCLRAAVPDNVCQPSCTRILRALSPARRAARRLGLHRAVGALRGCRDFPRRYLGQDQSPGLRIVLMQRDWPPRPPAQRVSSSLQPHPAPWPPEMPHRPQNARWARGQALNRNPLAPQPSQDLEAPGPTHPPCRAEGGTSPGVPGHPHLLSAPL